MLRRSADRVGRMQGTHVDAPGWTHTLILTGSLDHDSAAELEEEIECLRQEGVTALTIDLRRLDELESPGERVIATEGALFKQGGLGFAVIPEGLLGRDLPAEEHARELPLSASPEHFVPRFTNRRVRGDRRVRMTSMTKHLDSHCAEGA